jgi:hypothetical protein
MYAFLRKVHVYPWQITYTLHQGSLQPALICSFCHFQAAFYALRRHKYVKVNRIIGVCGEGSEIFLRNIG